MIKELNKLLSTIEVVAANVKGRHWTVSGNNFRSIHLVFDDIWKELMDGADRIAETIRVLGGLPYRSMTDFIEGTEVSQDAIVYDSKQMVKDTRDELNVIINNIQVGSVNNLFDPTTENDLLNITSHLRHWMLFLDGIIEQWGDPQLPN